MRLSPAKRRRHGSGLEMVVAAGVVLHLGSRRECRLDALLDVRASGTVSKRKRSVDGRLRRQGRRWTPSPGLATLFEGIAMITITDKGAEKVREFFAGQSADVSAAGLRVGVKGGGCSGFQYQLAFDEKRDTDAVFEDHGLKLLADRQSLPYVTGSVIDYEESLQGAGFQVNNPNVVAACGCGSSFRVAEEEQVSAV